MAEVCLNTGKLTVIRGSDRTFTVNLYSKQKLRPFNLTGLTEIKACFPKEDETVLQVALTGGQITVLGDPVLGVIQIELTDSDTSLLAVGEDQDFEVQVDIGATRSIVQFLESLTVVESIC